VKLGEGARILVLQVRRQEVVVLITIQLCLSFLLLLCSCLLLGFDTKVGWVEGLI
jgi:hypothetical protein